jgi:CDGSH-type Zn-finger protein
MAQPHIHTKSPAMCDMEEGKTYAYCTCGKSDGQPWCNGAHKGSEFNPLVFNAAESATKAICQCKQTSNPPYCDGSHNKL